MQTLASEGLQGLVTPPMVRRGFVMTSLIAGFTLATTRVDAQAIHTDSAGLEDGEIQVPVSDGHLPGYFARPKGAGPFPVVLVVEEIFGLHEYIKDICRRLAKQGYMAVSVELYARIADLSKMTDAAVIVRDVISKAPDATVMSDLDSSAAWAFANRGDRTRLGITGFCRGGRTVWLYTTHNPALKAAAVWYGPVAGTDTPIQPHTVLEVAGQVKCPVLGLYGAKDPSIAVADVQATAAKTRSEAHQPVEIVVYQDAAHAFHADYRPSYVRDAAEDGWKRMLAWFHGHGLG